MSRLKSVNDKDSFDAHKIRELREARQLNQKELAHLAGVPGANISRIEAGKQEPRVGTLRRIARALQVHLIDLIGDDEATGPKETGNHPVAPPGWWSLVPTAAQDALRVIVESPNPDRMRLAIMALEGIAGLALYTEIRGGRLHEGTIDGRKEQSTKRRPGGLSRRGD